MAYFLTLDEHNNLPRIRTCEDINSHFITHPYIGNDIDYTLTDFSFSFNEWMKTKSKQPRWVKVNRTIDLQG